MNYATIGSLSASLLDDLHPNKLRLTSSTNSMINADFEGSLTVDHRLLSEGGRADIAKSFKELGQNLKNMREEADKSPFKIGAVLNAPNTLLEGAIYTFTEKKNDPEGSQLVKASYDSKDNWTYKLTTTNDPTEGKNYVVNGVDTSQSLDGYFLSEQQSSDLISRYNPTHGILGDIVESGLTKVFNVIGAPEAIAMNRIVAEDMFDRKNINNATNTFVSEGTIIGIGAMQLYSKTFGQGIDLNGALSGNGTINDTQRFVAVAPAVSKEDWISANSLLGKQIGEVADYQHDKLDPVRYLTAPSNLINDTANLFGTKINSPIYLPNPLSTATGVGLGAYDLLNGGGVNNPHSISNPVYSKYLRNNQEQ